jgi:hypothetical protein
MFSGSVKNQGKNLAPGNAVVKFIKKEGDAGLPSTGSEMFEILVQEANMACFEFHEFIQQPADISVVLVDFPELLIKENAVHLEVETDFHRFQRGFQVLAKLKIRLEILHEIGLGKLLEIILHYLVIIEGFEKMTFGIVLFLEILEVLVVLLLFMRQFVENLGNLRFLLELLGKFEEKRLSILFDGIGDFQQLFESYSFHDAPLFTVLQGWEWQRI